IQGSIDAMREQVRRISEREVKKLTEPSQRTPFERAVMKLHGRLVLYMGLKNTVQPQDAQDWSKELADYESAIGPGVAAYRARQAGKEYNQAALDRFMKYAQKFDAMRNFEPPLLVPPHHPEHSRDEWMRMGEALIEAAQSHELDPAVKEYAAMATAFKQ